MADKKISELVNAGSLDGSELVVLVQDNLTKRTTAQAIADLGTAGSGVADMLPFISYFDGTSPTGVSVNFPIADGFLSPGQLMLAQGNATGNVLASSDGATFTSTNHARFQPFYVNKPVKLSRLGMFISGGTGAGRAVSARVYSTLAINGRPYLPVIDKVVFDASSTGWKEEAFSEVTLSAGLYWMVYGSNNSSVRCRFVTVSPKPVYYSGTPYTLLWQTALAVIDSTDASSEVFSVENSQTSTGSINQPIFGNFTAA